MALWQNWVLRFFGDKMANLGPIDFKIGLNIKVCVNREQKNVKSISQKMWPKLPLIGTEYACMQDTFARATHSA